MKESVVDKFYSPLIVLNIFLILVLIVLIFIEHGQNFFFNLPKVDTEVAVNQMIQDQGLNVITRETYGKKFIYMLTENEGKYVNYFIDYKTGNEMTLNDILKKGKQEEFNRKIDALIDLKYPKFVADVLKTENGNRVYELTETYLQIYFYDYQTEPFVSDIFTLRVYYKEIQPYLDFTVHIIDDYENENGYIYDKNKKTVAITFDDGPAGDRTLRLLDILNNNKAHGTFFMVGNRMLEEPEVVKKVYESKNEIGSHSYNHKNLTRLKPDELILQETETDRVFESITGGKLELLRPPYGAIDSKVKETLNYSFVNWSIDPEDWRYRDADAVYESIISSVQDGDIILLHDLYDSTVSAVERLLPELYAQGYQVVSVSELAMLKGSVLEKHQKYNLFR